MEDVCPPLAETCRVGYTHYWDMMPGVYDAAVFSQFVRDVRKVLQTSPVAIGGPFGDGEPDISDDVVSFNGVGEDIYETMRVARIVEFQDDPHKSSDFCKTGARPYDTVVTATLLLYAHYFPKLVRLSSDGDKENWKDGQELVRSACGFTPTIRLGRPDSRYQLKTISELVRNLFGR